MPLLSPATPGTWHALNNHMIQFHPEGYGYGLGATVKVALPSGVRVVGGTHTTAGTDASWIVPRGSTARLQQLLATLGYLPLRFNYAGAHVALTPAAQEAAAIKPPSGSFSMRWSNIPGWYKGEWSPGSYGELTKAAVMAFENTQGMTADGVDGPQVWNALIGAVIKHQNNSFGYTVVTVSEASPETESTWHNGKIGRVGPRQHRHPGDADRARHVRRVRARAVGDDERHQRRRQPLQRPGGPVGQLLQRRRCPPRLHPGRLRLSPERRLRRDAVQRGAVRLSIHADRDRRPRRVGKRGAPLPVANLRAQMSESTQWRAALDAFDLDLQRRAVAAKTRTAYAIDTAQFARWATSAGLAPERVDVRACAATSRR